MGLTLKPFQHKKSRWTPRGITWGIPPCSRRTASLKLILPSSSKIPGLVNLKLFNTKVLLSHSPKNPKLQGLWSNSPTLFPSSLVNIFGRLKLCLGLDVVDLQSSSVIFYHRCTLDQFMRNPNLRLKDIPFLTNKSAPVVISYKQLQIFRSPRHVTPRDRGTMRALWESVT